VCIITETLWFVKGKLMVPGSYRKELNKAVRLCQPDSTVRVGPDSLHFHKEGQPVQNQSESASSTVQPSTKPTVNPRMINTTYSL